jgi:hypothetical protein
MTGRVNDPQTVVAGIDQLSIGKGIPVNSVTTVAFWPRHFRESRPRPASRDRCSPGGMIVVRVRDDDVLKTIRHVCSDGVEMICDASPRVDQDRLSAGK